MICEPRLPSFVSVVRWTFFSAILAGEVIGGTGCQKDREAPRYDWDETPLEVLEPIREFAAGNDGFRSVDAFSADSAGTLYVGDTGFKQIVALDSTGTVLWRQPVSVAAQFNSMGTGFGHLAVGDRTQRVVLLLDSQTGVVLRSFDWVASSTAPFSNGQPLKITSHGGSVAFGIGDVLMEPDQKYPELSAVREYLVRFDETGAESRIELPQWTGILLSLPRHTGGSWGYRPALVPRLVWTPQPDGGWTGGDGYQYEITVHSPEGVERKWRRSVGPRQPSEAARELEMQILRSMGENHRKLKGNEADFVADTIGHFTSMAYSVDGLRLWVGRTYLEANPIYDVWDATGVFLCSVELEMGGQIGIVRRTPPYVINGKLYHLAVESLSSEEPTIKTFDVSNACGIPSTTKGASREDGF